MTRQQRRFSERNQQKQNGRSVPPPTPPIANPYGLHVYATGCVWSGPIESVGLIDTGNITVRGKQVRNPRLPCCPHCQSVLFQIDADKWWDGAVKHEQKGHLNYVEFLKWKEAQPRCWPTLALAAAAFTEATGKPVTIKL